MREEEGGLDGTAVRVVASLLEQALVHLDVVVVDGIIEADHDHLGDGVRLQATGDLRPVRGTEAVWQDTL